MNTEFSSFLFSVLMLLASRSTAQEPTQRGTASADTSCQVFLHPEKYTQQVMAISGKILYRAHDFSLGPVDTCGGTEEFGLSYDPKKLGSYEPGATFLKFLNEPAVQVCQSNQAVSHQITSSELWGRLRRTADLLRERNTDVTVDADKAGLPQFTFVVEKLIRMEAKEQRFSCVEELVLPLPKIDNQLVQSTVLPPNN